MRIMKADDLSLLAVVLLAAAGAATVFSAVLLYKEMHPVPATAGRTVMTVQEAPSRATPESIRQALESAGFRQVRNIRRRGQHFSAEAQTGAGLEARIVIHGTSGAILGIRVTEEPSGTRVVGAAGR